MSHYDISINRVQIDPEKVLDDCIERITFNEYLLEKVQSDEEFVSHKNRDIFINLLEIVIKIAKLEILVIKNIINPNTNKRIYPLLLEKYDALLNEDYEIRQQLVQDDDMDEDDYRLHCKKSMDVRNIIKTICKSGEMVSDNFVIQRIH